MTLDKKLQETLRARRGEAMSGGGTKKAEARHKKGLKTARERVMALFDGRLARFKHPREVVFLERLPRNVMGKVLKDELLTRWRPRR